MAVGDQTHVEVTLVIGVSICLPKSKTTNFGVLVIFVDISLVDSGAIINRK